MFCVPHIPIHLFSYLFYVQEIHINPIKACLIYIVGLASPQSKFYADSESVFRIFLPLIFQILGNFLDFFPTSLNQEKRGKIKTLLQKWDPTSNPTYYIDSVVDFYALINKDLYHFNFYRIPHHSDVVFLNFLRFSAQYIPVPNAKNKLKFTFYGP